MVKVTNNTEKITKEYRQNKLLQVKSRVRDSNNESKKYTKTEFNLLLYSVQLVVSIILALSCLAQSQLGEL